MTDVNQSNGEVPATEAGTAVAGGEPATARVELAGLPLERIDQAGLVARIAEQAAVGRGGWVLTPNLDILCKCERNPELAALARQADLRVADGMPLIWASRLLGAPLPERVAGSDLIYRLSSAAAERGLSVFLLGGERGTAEAAARTLRQRDPNLIVAGTYYPPYGFEQDAEEMDRLRQTLIAAEPNIIYVGLGFPKQERLIARLREACPRAWWLGVGISFSFVCGRVRRAPRWVQRLGLEWVHRLAQEPRRLIRRYVIDDIPFAIRLLARSAVRRRGRRRAGAGLHDG